MRVFVCPLSYSYLSDNCTDISQESNSRPHIVPHLLSTKVNLHTENNCVVITAQHLQQQWNTVEEIRPKKHINCIYCLCNCIYTNAEISN